MVQESSANTCLKGGHQRTTSNSGSLCVLGSASPPAFLALQVDMESILSKIIGEIVNNFSTVAINVISELFNRLGT